jgi:hypothetical protein
VAVKPGLLRRMRTAQRRSETNGLPDGDLAFRAIEGGSNFLYRMKADGTTRRKITSQRILDVNSVSPDGRWVVASATNSDEDNRFDQNVCSGWKCGSAVVRPLVLFQVGHDWKVCLSLFPRSLSG